MLFPALTSQDYTRIVNDRHQTRLLSTLKDATAKGARVAMLSDAASGVDRLVPPALIFDARDDMEIMREEIFGPLLPVVSYRTLHDAIAYVNERPRPLALYYFDHSRDRMDEVLARTLSGGVTVNDCLLHLGQHNLPFGGVGASGMGHYHGFAGFETFSKKRGVMLQSRWPTSTWFRPPYSPLRRRLIDLLLRIAAR
jgi:coniferyl-aldehyde dehydrogenase